jgi:polysaccharide pyruvyl transferase WcaK-like protein
MLDSLQAPLGRELASWWASSDLVVVAGRGGLTDALAEDAHELLDILEASRAAGVPFALFSQGLGPISGRLRDRAAKTLPDAVILGLRDGRTGPVVAEALGVPGERVLVTGDDAIALALHGPAARMQNQDRIGVCIRSAAYSGVGEEESRTLGEAILDAARGVGDAPIMPVSIAASDARTYEQAFRRPAVGHDGVAERTVEDIAHCRIVVTGAYHAAVFALAQGIPAVGLASTDYYAAKFGGLAHAFGSGLTVVPVGEPNFRAHLDTAVRAAWDTPPVTRHALRERAHELVASSEAAYDLLGQWWREQQPVPA